MRLSPAILWTLTSVLALTGPAWAWRACAGARSRAESARAGLATLRDKCDELVRLRAAAPRWSAEPRDEETLAPRVASALASAGIPASALAALSPQSQPVTGAGGARLTKRGAAVTLAPVTLPELGAFLQNWRASAPGWIVSSIEVAPAEAGGAAPGADLPLRVNLTIESLLAEDAGGTP